MQILRGGLELPPLYDTLLTYLVHKAQSLIESGVKYTIIQKQGMIHTALPATAEAINITSTPPNSWL